MVFCTLLAVINRIMIMEILQYVLGSFWRFCGFTTILYLILYFGVNGLVQLVKAFMKG